MGPRIADSGFTAGRMGRFQSLQCQGLTGRSDYVRSGESTFGDRDWLCRSVYAAIIAALVPVISALLDVIATRRMIDFRLFIAVILSLVGGLIATLNDQEMELALE